MRTTATACSTRSRTTRTCCSPTCTRTAATSIRAPAPRGNRRRRRRGHQAEHAVPPGAGDADFVAAWPRVEDYLRRHAPEFILFQCGADSLDGDPITHLRFTEEAHARAAARLCAHRRRAWATDACSGWAAAATTAATSRAPGPRVVAGLRRVGTEPTRQFQVDHRATIRGPRPQEIAMFPDQP